MADELIDIYDEANNFTGVRKMKSEAHKDGLYHRTAHVWVYNGKGEVLLQLRAKSVPFFPGKWDMSAGGHINTGEEEKESALRELKEELGLSATEIDLKFFKIKRVRNVFRKMINNEFFYIYFLKCSNNLNTFQLQAEEVQEVKFYPIDQLEQRLKTNSDEFCPHGDYWSEVINYIRSDLTATSV